MTHRSTAARSRAKTLPSVAEVIEDFLAAAGRGAAHDRDGRRYSREALAELDWCLRGHVREALGELRIDQVRRDDVEDLIVELADEGISRRRRRAVATSVRALYDYAMEERLVRRNPAERVALHDFEEDAPSPERTAIGRAISVGLQGATVVFALVAILLIAGSL